jgi:catalase (peroxidase I)
MNELDTATFPANGGLFVCPPIITALVNTVRQRGCPGLSFADAIQVAGAVAVYVSGGPQCPLLMGRPDVSSGGTDSIAGLPHFCNDAGELVSTFASMGFSDPVTAVTVLSGAHNIGVSRVTGRDGCSRGLVSPLSLSSPPLP